MNKDPIIVDIDAVIKEVEQDEKDAESTGVYIQLQQQKIPLRIEDMTLWNWTKLFMLYVAPLRDDLKYLKKTKLND